MRFSIATDISVMRNFSPKQKFFAIGQTVQPLFHLSSKETVYAWLSYYSRGKFHNDFTATAKSPATVPQAKTFRVTGQWLSNEVSVGWKHYVKGSFDQSETWSLYTIAGFGLMFAKVENIFRPNIDTSVYQLAAPVPGLNSFNRLTLDLGLGLDYPVGGNFFIYADARTWIPMSDYPSPYLHSNKNVPLPVTISAGLRILFDMGY